MKEVKGNLISLALAGEFDVIAHGCNCFCTMGAGIAPKMAEVFGCNDPEIFYLEDNQWPHSYKGDINKLGQIEFNTWEEETYDGTSITKPIKVVNAYAQYGFGCNHPGGTNQPLDYVALALCFQKMNHIFKGEHIGLPWIGCGLAGGDIKLVKQFIEMYFVDCEVTLVEYDGN
jgi:O-acetyl-ADP-ribose deacetylase (regulator of RNase III)